MYLNYYIRNRTLHIRSKFVLDKKEEYEKIFSQIQFYTPQEVQFVKDQLIQDILRYHHHPNHFITILREILQTLLDFCNQSLNLPKETIDQYLAELVYL